MRPCSEITASFEEVTETNRQALEHALAFIRPWLEWRYDHQDIPGFVVAIAHQGDILLNEAFGYADLEQGVPMTPQHVFRIASHSKTFTATAVMLLAEEGTLRIDNRVTDYLPWLKDHRDRRWANVTLRQLLSHGAGVIRDGVANDYWSEEKPFPSQAQLTEELMATSLVIDNNTQMKYTNYGYSLLGLVIEAVSGKPYHEFVTERIIKPLNMVSTFPDYRPEFDQPLQGTLATGYSRRDNKIRPPLAHVDTHGMVAATGFCSTAQDLCAYFTAHMVGSGQLLSDESKKEMQRIHWQAKTPGEASAMGYGLGLMTESTAGRRLFGHSGGFPGFITKSLVDPKDELVVVALTNCIDGPASNFVAGIYKILDYFQEHIPSAKPHHDLSYMEGAYMNLWGMASIVVTGDTIVSVNPDSWEPFAAPDILTYVNSHILKVVDTGSFGSEGELVHFNIADGAVETISYTGATMWPRDAWLKRLQARTAESQ